MRAVEKKMISARLCLDVLEDLDNFCKKIRKTRQGVIEEAIGFFIGFMSRLRVKGIFAKVTIRRLLHPKKADRLVKYSEVKKMISARIRLDIFEKMEELCFRCNFTRQDVIEEAVVLFLGSVEKFQVDPEDLKVLVSVLLHRNVVARLGKYGKKKNKTREEIIEQALDRFLR